MQTKNEEPFNAEVFSFGRITIPKKVREAQGIKDGNFVKVTVEKLRV